MIVLWIIGSFIIIITILLNCHVTAELMYADNIFKITVKYLFFTIYPQKEKTEKIKKNEKSSNIEKKNSNLTKSKFPNKKNDIPKYSRQPDIPIKTNEYKSDEAQNLKNEESNNPDNKKDELFEKIAFYKSVLESSKSGLKRLVKGIYISDINLNFIIADDDAFCAAVNYGKINMVTFNVISFLRVFFTISLEKIDITCKFNSSDSKYDGKCKVNLRPSTAILSAISIFCHYMINTNKKKKANLKENPQSAS